METIITVIHILTAVFMILVVLVQGGNSGGIGAAFGGGNSTGFFGASGATSFLGKLTYGAAGIFMLTSITLSVYSGSSGDTGLKERLQQQSGTTEPAADNKAATDTSAPQGQPATEKAAPVETKPAGEGAAPQN